jgi:hypothetical protein
MGYHGMKVGGLDGSLYTVFAPPWWKLHLWVWWFWRTRVERWLVRVWRALTPFVKRDRTRTFDTGVIELRVGNEAFRVRVYRDRETWLVWTPPPPAPPPLAGKLDVRPDDALPPSNDVHPMERGL